MSGPDSPKSDTGMRREMMHLGRKITIYEDSSHCEVAIDGISVDAARMGPRSYHSRILLYQEFPSAEALAKALTEAEGTVWRLPTPSKREAADDTSVET